MSELTPEADSLEKQHNPFTTLMEQSIDKLETLDYMLDEDGGVEEGSDTANAIKILCEVTVRADLLRKKMLKKFYKGKNLSQLIDERII